MATFRDLMHRCDFSLRTHLEHGERVLAIGRCEDITERGSIEGGGAGWTFVMVTDRKVRWVPRVDPRFEASLDLDDVTGVTERLLGHRYAIALEHRPIVRPRHVPAYRILMFEWGNSIGDAPLARTEFAFSRRDTDAASALRELLTGRGSL